MEQITKPHCGARLDRLPDCRWHSSMFAVVAFGLLVCWSNAVGGLILAQLKELGWTDNSTTATFSAITTAGMFLGALVGGIIGDKTGRRNAFILYEAIHIASMVVGAFSPNMMFLIACRFVMGVGLGALLVTLFAGFTEYMPGRNRGTWSSRVSFIGNWSYPLCSLIAMGLTPLISAEWNWRVQLLIPAVLSLIATALAWRYFPESPRWLESRGRYQEAEKVIQAIEAGIERQTGKLLPPVVIESSGKPPRSVPYSALLTGVLLKRVILGSCVLIAMNVVQYTLINWLPTIFMTQGINLKDSIVLNTMSMFGAPFGIFIAMLVMDKIPRKTMGVGLLILIAVLGYIYSHANQHVAHHLNWLFPDYLCLYVCLLCLGGLCAGDLANRSETSRFRPGERCRQNQRYRCPLCGGGITQRLWRDGRFRPAGRCLDYRRRRNSDYRNRDQGCFGRKSGH